jgi:hypothetical protein
MPRPRAPTVGVTVPADLLALYRTHEAADPTLPPASRLLESAMRAELGARGVELPPLRPPTRTAAATAARVRRRAEAREDGRR